MVQLQLTLFLSTLVLISSCAMNPVRKEDNIRASKVKRDVQNKVPYQFQHQVLQKDRCYTVIAHRGASGYLPEHTREAYERAIEMGADFIEPDLVITKDGVLIVRHENELSLSTDVAQKFPKRKTKKTIAGKAWTGWFSEDFTLAEIKTLKARQRFEFRDLSFDGKFDILTFAEVVQLAKVKSKEAGRPIGLYPEGKNPSYFASIGLPLEGPLLAELKKHSGSLADVPMIIQSFELSFLEQLKKHTNLPLVFLIGSPFTKPDDAAFSGDKRTYGDFLKPSELKALSKTVFGIGPWKSLVAPDDRSADQKGSQLIQDAHAAGLKVHGYTFRSDKEMLPGRYNNDPALEYQRFCQLGIDGVFTDFPDHAVKAMSVDAE